MGSCDGAETCELVGLYLLSQLEDLGINVGLYRHDGLAVTNKTPRQVEIIKKKMCSIFWNNGLNITIEANKKVVDFLDVTLNLNTGTYKPYKKPNDIVRYIHAHSNHPPVIIKNLVQGTEKRLSNNSANAKIFEEAASTYNAALKQNGHTKQLSFVGNKSSEINDNVANTTLNETTDKTSQQRATKGAGHTRKRRITWFNPPFDKSVATNIGKKFFTLLSACFPRDHKLHKIINRNTIKLSYSCMTNVKNIITNHNKAILKSKENQNSTEKLCNCRIKNECPLEGKCLQKCVVYQATIKQKKKPEQVDTYIGITENHFKTRYNQHKSSFRLSHRKFDTTLSERIWNLKENKKEFALSWKIMEKSNAFSTSTKKCNLCLLEKYYIISKKPSLKKRKELLGTCMHRDRRSHLLAHACAPHSQHKQTNDPDEIDCFEKSS
ncbi:inositol hexakisphosphate and diphosphoinositol-pentakisphosphate kinase 2 [Elysia marginata]|uniref:Inositol hexakisphosphate and diphosphoinositol-pentakisphosphate kinase 2 n=1 Tax=Elysia marginata TaxID=1093978 RepID=A0AAV4FH52_9GAST|nr:inositol hexakisphosphate and diphosphoinositol-pentakisphosphate kinase 2 [Elysia marginata]